MDKFIMLKRTDGGKMIIPLSELGIASTDMRIIEDKHGTRNEVMNENQALIHVRCLNQSVVVAHTVDEIWGFLNEGFLE